MAGNGASLTYLVQADTIIKGGFIVIHNRPCKVHNVSISRAAKSSKCTFIAIDIFNGKQRELQAAATEMIDVPFVTKKEYTLVDVNADGQVSLMDPDGKLRNDLKLPTGTPEFEAVARQLDADAAIGKKAMVTVTKAMNEEMITSVKAE